MYPHIPLYSSATHNTSEMGEKETFNNSLSLCLTFSFANGWSHLLLCQKSWKSLGGLGESSGSEYVSVLYTWHRVIECDSFFVSLSPMLTRIPPWTMINLMLANEIQICKDTKLSAKQQASNDTLLNPIKNLHFSCDLFIWI